MWTNLLCELIYYASQVALGANAEHGIAAAKHQFGYTC